MLQKIKNSRGFTLIEVVIVLAIGALIILVVLQAVTAAQRNQRDSARRQEAGQISAALEQYAANNGGLYPASAGDVSTAIDSYASDVVGKYTYSPGSFTAGTPDTITGCPGTITSSTYTILYDPQTTGSGQTRNYYLGVCLEGAEGGVVIKGE